MYVFHSFIPIILSSNNVSQYTYSNMLQVLILLFRKTSILYSLFNVVTFFPQRHEGHIAASNPPKCTPLSSKLLSSHSPHAKASSAYPLPVPSQTLHFFHIQSLLCIFLTFTFSNSLFLPHP